MLGRFPFRVRVGGALGLGLAQGDDLVAQDGSVLVLHHPGGLLHLLFQLGDLGFPVGLRPQLAAAVGPGVLGDLNEGADVLDDCLGDDAVGVVIRLLVAAAGMLAEHFGASEGASIQANMPAYKEAWMIIFIIISALLLLLGLYHSKVLPSTQVPNQEKRSSSDVAKELWEVIKNFFTKKHIFYYICFIILYRFAEGFIMKIAPLFLRSSRDIGGLGLSLTEIGTLNGVFGSAAFVLGSLLAGVYVSRRGLKKTLFTLCCVFNFPFVAYTLLAIFQPENLYLIGTGIVIEYFGYGFGFVGLTLFMMQQIAPGKHQMSHYAFASGIMNLGVMLPGMMSGFFSDWLGYERFFIYVLLATIPSLLITYFIPFTYDDSKKESNR